MEQETLATETKEMAARSLRPSGGEEAFTSQEVAAGDQETKGTVRMAKCSQEYIDWLLRLEKEKPIRNVNLDLVDGYTGSYDYRERMLECHAAVEKLLASHAAILRQYRATGVVYIEVGDEPSV